MKTTLLLISVLLVVVVVSIASFAQEPAKKFKPPPIEKVINPKVGFPDDPEIREFFVIPNLWLQSEKGNVLFKWRLEPFPFGNPISAVTITRISGKGPSVNYSVNYPGKLAIGEYTVSISSILNEGVSSYSLVATDEKRNTFTRTVEFEVKSMLSVREDITMVSLQTDPEQIGEDEPFTFILKLNNRSGIKIPAVNIPMWGEDISLISPVPDIETEHPPNQGELPNQIIVPGMNEYRIRCTPGIPPGLANQYLFTIIPKYKSYSIAGALVRLEHVGGNLYRIRVFESKY